MGNIQTKIKKFDLSLFVSCLVGGLLGMFISEYLYKNIAISCHPVLTCGFYFLIVMLGMGSFGLTSEFITGNLRESNWTGGEKLKAAGIFLGLTLAFALIAMLFQFLYGLGYSRGHTGTVDDYIILIDNSASTYDTDPDKQRFTAVEELIDGLNDSHQIMIEIFDDQVLDVFPLTMLNNKTRKTIIKFMNNARTLECGNTDIQLALMEAIDQYTDTGRSSVLLLLSDGDSYVDYDVIKQAFNNKSLPIYSVAFSGVGFQGNNLLNQLANNTDGFYYHIEELGDLADVVKSMIRLTNQRSLLESRRGSDFHNILAMIERILFVSTLGILMLLILTAAVDIRSLLTQGMVLHVPLSILAGFLIEFGTCYWNAKASRMMACVLFSVIVVYYMKISYINMQTLKTEKDRIPEFHKQGSKDKANTTGKKYSGSSPKELR